MIGQSLGSYQIVGKLGEGGMGQVYRARDTRLNRDVAIKVLPDLFATDADRMARFTREAQTLAALNHPHIAQIHGMEEAAGRHALVMELVEGDDLSVHIARGPMPIADVLPIATQIADALETAHERGIIHRDLKPANIKVRSDGTVKVLDFGLAKALGADSASSADAMQSPTITARATALGVILGTAAYMAPEQAKGRPVDRRADIWAFGVVLYEMLSGRRPFGGDDVTETLASVIKDTPDFSALPETTPPRLRQLVERCLVRDPKSRLRDIGEARLELTAIAAAPASDVDRIVAAPTRATPPLLWIAAGFAAGAVLVTAGWVIAGSSRPAGADTSAATARFQLTLPDDVQLDPTPGASLGVSPDGRTLVFVARKGTATNQLWLRALDSTEVTPLPGTEGGRLPFWSPDGTQLGFFSSGSLKKIDLRSNVVTTLAEAPNGGGGTWNQHGDIVYPPMIEGPLFRVSAGGGTPVQVTSLDPAEKEANHMWPHFLPDGRRFLFQVLGLNNRGIYAGTLDSPERTLVIKQDRFDMTAVQYAASGHLVYVRNHQLVGRPFDADRLAVTGDEVALAEGFSIGGPGAPHFALSRTGVLAWRPEGARPMMQPTWFTRAGVRQGTLGPPGPYGPIELSRDGRLVALEQTTQRDNSVWIMDVDRGTLARFTSDAYSADPVWFPESDRLAFVSVRDTPPNPFVKTLAGQETRLARVPNAVVAGGVTPDGRLLIGSLLAPGTRSDLWIFPTTPGEAPRPFLDTPFNEYQPRLSKDGNWVVFTSNESGANEVYVTSFPNAGRRHRLSTSGGDRPQWNPNGEEIFFRSGSRLMSVSFSASAGREPVLGAPQLLFSLPERAGRWVPADDGKRFLINVEVTPVENPPMTILLNWAGLARPR